MSVDDIKKLPNGLYIIIWSENEGGGFSLAALGRDRAGNPWIAPTNWTSGSTTLEDSIEKIDKMLLVLEKADVFQKICPHKNARYRNSAIMECDDCGAQWQE